MESKWTTLNDGTVVLAVADGLYAVKYTNWKQATARLAKLAAECVEASVYRSGRVLYIAKGN